MKYDAESPSLEMTILELRKERGESQAEFGLSLGLNASKVSEIETGLRPVSLRVALKIEELSILDGVPRINAAALNDDVARARAACAGGCASGDDEAVLDHAALDNASDAPASTGQIGQMSRAVAA